MAKLEATEFEAFARQARPRLIRALAPSRGQEAVDGASEALAYAWEHWADVRQMDNPVGFLYRVGQSRTRQRRTPTLPAPETIGLPDIEPRLLPALLALLTRSGRPFGLFTPVSGVTPMSRKRSAPHHRWSAITSHADWHICVANWRCTVLELEDQLRRYGEALERHLLGNDISGAAPECGTPRRRVRLAAAAILLVVVGIVGMLAAHRVDEASVVSTEHPTTGVPRTAGVFSVPTDTVLVFTDGIDGVTAIDLDRRLAGRRVIDGERAGDQQHRLTLTADHLIVGWGEIYAAPLTGAPSKRIAEATIYLPASESGEVWTVTWSGERIGQGSATVQRVRTDGTVTFTSEAFDPMVLEPVLGVPGGIAVNTPEGVAIWDAGSETTGPVLGAGPARSMTSDGLTLAWCESTCALRHEVTLERRGRPTAPHVAPAGQRIALTADGQYLAFLRPADGRAELVVVDRPTGLERVVAQQLDPDGALQWRKDGHQLFFTENSYGQSAMRIGLYDTTRAEWEVATIPVGAGVAAIALEASRAHMFFSNDVGPPADCSPPPDVYPSGRRGGCTFAFPSPDTPDECVVSGEPIITVPDAEGRSLDAAVVLMQQADLTVVGDGVPDDDPTGDGATVRAQEPPAGSKVPVGACIGFRTRH